MTGLCRPYDCRYPRPGDFPTGWVWTCPVCGAKYRKRRPVKPRWWRNWSAPDGYWVTM